MGCKKWSGGSQIGLRIYHPSILALKDILDTPSRNSKWSSLNQFLNSSQKNYPYSRKLMILDSKRENPIRAITTIARHGESSTQGYITAPRGSWLYNFINNNLGRNYNFDYRSTLNYDLLIIPYPSKDIISNVIKEKEEKEMKQVVKSYTKKHQFSPPPEAKKIGLYFELEEVKYLTKNELIPKHRYPSLKTKVDDLLKYNVSCDIDVFYDNKKFCKFVEVKSVTGPPDTEFNLTIAEFESRKKCRKKGWNYEIVIYYHHGNKIIKRRVINISEKIRVEPSGYWVFIE